MKLNRQNERKSEQLYQNGSFLRAWSRFDQMWLNQPKMQDSLVNNNERNFGSNLTNSNPFICSKNHDKKYAKCTKKVSSFRRTISAPINLENTNANPGKKNPKSKKNKTNENNFNMSSIPEDSSENAVEPNFSSSSNSSGEISTFNYNVSSKFCVKVPQKNQNKIYPRGRIRNTSKLAANLRKTDNYKSFENSQNSEKENIQNFENSKNYKTIENQENSKNSISFRLQDNSKNSSKNSLFANFSKSSLVTEASTKTTESCVFDEYGKEKKGRLTTSLFEKLQLHQQQHHQYNNNSNNNSNDGGDYSNDNNINNINNINIKKTNNTINNIYNNIPQAELNKINDPRYALEYISEIISSQKELETTNQPNYNIFTLSNQQNTPHSIPISKHINLTFPTLQEYEVHRKKVFYRMYKQQIKFGLLDETVFLAQYIVDKFKTTIPQPPYIDDHLLSSSVLFTASKVEEIYPPFIYEYYPNKQKMIQTELTVLTHLSFNLNYASPIWFLCRFHSISGCNMEILELAKLMLDFGCLKIQFAKLKNSLKASICLYHAIYTYNIYINKCNNNNNNNINNNNNDILSSSSSSYIEEYTLLKNINKKKTNNNNNNNNNNNKQEIPINPKKHIPKNLNKPNNTFQGIWTNDLILWSGYTEKDLAFGICVLKGILKDAVFKFNSFTNIYMKKNKQNPSNADFFSETSFNGIIIMKYSFVNRYNVSRILFPLIREEKMIK